MISISHDSLLKFISVQSRRHSSIYSSIWSIARSCKNWKRSKYSMKLSKLLKICMHEMSFIVTWNWVILCWTNARTKWKSSISVWANICWTRMSCCTINEVRLRTFHQTCSAENRTKANRQICGHWGSCCSWCCIVNFPFSNPRQPNCSRKSNRLNTLFQCECGRSVEAKDNLINELKLINFLCFVH